MESESLTSLLESILFVSNKPLSVKELAKLLEQPDTEIQNALAALKTQREHTGVVILESNGEYQMATNPAHSTQVKNFLNADLREKLTDATVEVLAIIAYRQPISKAEIEAIRGVNSQYSVRHLLMRGLIEKIPNPNDSRSSYYQTTTEFLQHMGIASVKELPTFEELTAQIKLPETPAMAEANQAETSHQPAQTETVPPQENSSQADTLSQPKDSDLPVPPPPPPHE